MDIEDREEGDYFAADLFEMGTVFQDTLGDILMVAGRDPPRMVRLSDGACFDNYKAKAVRVYPMAKVVLGRAE